MYADTDVVRWFQQVADGRTVTEVSELERVTQSGVSRALARLEIAVGTSLLRGMNALLASVRSGVVAAVVDGDARAVGRGDRAEGGRKGYGQGLARDGPVESACPPHVASAPATLCAGA
jgi:Bacterial regulatory helix-turn-helix protein, lysR family